MIEAGQRLHRLLAVLTWLARVQRAPLDELAERFGMSPADLVTDLELAACCGLPPYTPDQLMEILVDEHEVTANLGPELARPRRLTAAEGFALAASARAILATPGADRQGALSKALAKLESALGADGRLRVDLGDAAHLAEVRRAADEGRQLQVRYYSVSSDQESERVVDPLSVLAIDGRWYLDAYCHHAGSMRRFRVDRMVSVAPTGQAVDHSRFDGPSGPSGGPATEAFLPSPDATVARLAVEPGGMWLVEAVPTLGTAPLPDGRTEVRLAVASPVWFDRLLLRLGAQAEVLAPPELVGAGRASARRLLERYGVTAPS
ncbi:MAG TPA: WYL domain-containing protein [Acidimicrobiales bacterium]|nr:WYL domain-containing protein [Acidimicrobiales bacterium]